MRTDSGTAGHVFDIGYQRYTGAREGRIRALKSIFLDALKNGLGIGRGGWAKFLPWLMIAPTILVGFAFATVNALTSQALGDASSDSDVSLDLFSHSELYAATVFIILLFAAVMGPEQLCPDRRQGVLHLYLVRPISLLDYLATRWCGFATIVFAVALIPQITLFVGILFGVPDLPDYINDNWTDVPRFVGMAALLAIFATSLTFAMASMTTRRMIATIIVMGLFIVTPIVVGLIVELAELGDAEDWIRLLDLSSLNIETINQIVFGDYQSEGALQEFVPLTWYLLIAAASALFTWQNYTRLN